MDRRLCLDAADKARKAVMAEALNRPAERDEAADAIRGFIGRVALTPGARRGAVHATLHGEFGALREWLDARVTKEARNDDSPGACATGPGVC